MRKFKKGDSIIIKKVFPQDEALGIRNGDVGTIIELDYMQYNRYIVKMDKLLNPVPMIENQMDHLINCDFSPTPDNPQEIKFSSIGELELSNFLNGYIKAGIDGDIKINSGCIKPNNKKEKNNMEILELFLSRKSFKINNEFNINKREILEKDEIQKIFQDTENQVNVLLDKNECNAFKIGYNNIVSKETEKKLLKLEAERDKKTDQLHSDYEEVKALLSMTNDYQEQIKILKNYNIIDKKTNKLNV